MHENSFQHRYAPRKPVDDHIANSVLGDADGALVCVSSGCPCIWFCVDKRRIWTSGRPHTRNRDAASDGACACKFCRRWHRYVWISQRISDQLKQKKVYQRLVRIIFSMRNVMLHDDINFFRERSGSKSNVLRSHRDIPSLPSTKCT